MATKEITSCHWCKRDIESIVNVCIGLGQGCYLFYCLDCALHSPRHNKSHEMWRKHMNDMGKFNRASLTKEWCLMRAQTKYDKYVHDERVPEFTRKINCPEGVGIAYM